MERAQVDTLYNAGSFLEAPLQELMERAGKVRKTFLGNRMELCSIINAKSGLCREDCKFCAQSSRNKTHTPSYPLKDANEIVNAAKKAKEIGAGKFGIVTSGNRPNKAELENITLAISRIKNEIGINVCASLGALNKEDLKKLKIAGLSRYHHNIETSPRFYSTIVSTHSFEERVNTIRSAKEAGLEVCSGGIIGMGETWQDRIEMALLLKELDVDSVPINMLVPIAGTAMEDVKPMSREDAIRTICIFRIILKDKLIKIAAGRESVLGDFQIKGFLAGANGMLIGGYLTVKGGSVESDHHLLREIKKLWEE